MIKKSKQVLYCVFNRDIHTNNNNNNNTMLSLSNFHNSILYTQQTNKTNYLFSYPIFLLLSFPLTTIHVSLQPPPPPFFFSTTRSHYPCLSLIFSPFPFPNTSSFILFTTSHIFFFLLSHHRSL